ncbi:hypothetical protein C8P66_1138 [Humitalea rosea]|uniref:Tripartite-type tricarboxylate transporter receptor subunit TctC n=1 Tax=Humitalea rosea TaxID=990373 RepID=A0A2W7IGT3_9PROT|nr:hypothetical protein [Humitalea rosea]PZW44842.1 hypothetical protein C8P66_1138 [Humitalea rosea]
MTTSGASLSGRRALLALALAARPAWAQSADTATLLLPGPETGPLALFGARAAAGLARNMPQAVALRLETLGGPDGVTAANRFATSDTAGRALLMLPGAAVHARMVGDARVQFEPTGWLPLLAMLQPAWIAGRGALPPTGGRSVWRVAISGTAHAEAAALLALDLMGIPAAPVMVGVLPGAAEAAIRADQADVLMLLGPDLPARANSLDLQPWQIFEPASARNQDQATLALACLAAVTSLRLQGLLVLPALTGSDQAASWRLAATRFVEDEQRDSHQGLLGPIPASDLMPTLFPAPDAILAWREWAQRRLGTRAG